MIKKKVNHHIHALKKKKLSVIAGSFLSDLSLRTSVVLFFIPSHTATAAVPGDQLTAQDVSADSANRD